MARTKRPGTCVICGTFARFESLVRPPRTGPYRSGCSTASALLEGDRTLVVRLGGRRLSSDEKTRPAVKRRRRRVIQAPDR